MRRQGSFRQGALTLWAAGAALAARGSNPAGPHALLVRLGHSICRASGCCEQAQLEMEGHEAAGFIQAGLAHTLGSRCSACSEGGQPCRPTRLAREAGPQHLSWGRCTGEGASPQHTRLLDAPAPTFRTHNPRLLHLPSACLPTTHSHLSAACLTPRQSTDSPLPPRAAAHHSHAMFACKCAHSQSTCYRAAAGGRGRLHKWKRGRQREQRRAMVA